MLELGTVHQGDCLELMRLIPDESIDMILCDLPYGTTACKWDTVIPFEPLWAQYKRIIKHNGAIVLTASQPFTSALVMSNSELFRYELVWEKSRNSHPFFAKVRPLPAHENILVFGKKTPYYVPQKERSDDPFRVNKKTSGRTHGDKKGKQWDGESCMSFERYPKSVVHISNPSLMAGEHPTQKPVALFEYLIRTYTNEGDTVLDNCAGSGTTAVAAINTGRKFVLIEREPEYVAICHRRIAEARNNLFAVAS